jgi:hypothetical protein
MSQGEGGGRPSKYKPAFCKQAKTLSKMGATDFELAQFFDISVPTLHTWMHTHPKFLSSIKLGKAPGDKRVERSLFERANGYTYASEELFQVDHTEEIPNADPALPPTIIRTKKIIRVPILKHVPPDTTAQIFWLKNRRKDRWRDFKATELSTAPGRPLEMAAVNPSPMLLQDYYAKIAQGTAAADADPAAARPVGPDRPDGEEPDGDTDFGPR